MIYFVLFDCCKVIWVVLVYFIPVHWQGGKSYQHFLRDLYDDIVQRLVVLSSGENIFVWQPCRDNTLYLLRLIDEMLISELDNKLPVSKNKIAS